VELAPAAKEVAWRGQRFGVVKDAAVAAAVTEFTSDFEAGTLEFFDAVLPACDRMIDVGAYVGLMSLYAASRVAEVCAFEASPTNFDLLARNVAVNVGLQERIRLFPHGLSNRDERVALFRKAVADSGSSIFRSVERGGIVNGAPEAIVELRDADVVLRGLGVTGRTLLKIDIEGAEYLVVPRISSLLAEAKPFLHLSFHPFNLVAADAYETTVVRLQGAMRVAEALAAYRYMYFYTRGRWHSIEAADRMIFLREYLLKPKPVPRIATPQYGFIEAVGFADVALIALGGSGSAAPPARE
jgi:FkbM family methyltransferase